MIVVGVEYETRDGAAGLAPRRVVTVTDVRPGKHLIDRGPTAAPPDDDVAFTFADGTSSVCSTRAFGRTYRHTTERTQPT